MKNIRNLFLLVFLAVLGCGQSLVEFPADGAPTITVVSPANTTTGVPTNTKVSAAFSKAMNAETLNVKTFVLTGAGAYVAGTMTYSGTTVTLTPSTPLARGTVYTATITKSATDEVGHPLAANYVWSFTTREGPDMAPPTVLSTNPADKSSGVATNTRVSAVFSEAMNAATLSAATFTVRDGVTPVAGTVVYSGLTATFTAANALAASATLTATITTGARDLAGNALASAYVWTFSTGARPDTTAPKVTFTVPAANATSVSANTVLHVAFDEAMDCTTLDATTLSLKEGAVSVLGVVACSGTTATFTPTSALTVGSAFTATVTTGVRDFAGNAMAASHVWGFTTSAAPDATPPKVTFTVPVDGATSVDAKAVVSVAFDEMMDCATLNAATLTLKQGAVPVPGVVGCSGPTATFTPTSDLAIGAVFTATVTSGVKDLAGNALAASHVWGFTTGALPDATPPTITFTDPADGAKAVDANSTVHVAFDEAMDCATLNAVTFTVLQGLVPVPGVVSCSGPNAAFTPTNPLVIGEAFTATITNGAKDLAGNALAANYVWGFSTGAPPDATPPTVTFTDPTDGAKAVNVATTVRVAFDEAMDCTTLNAATFTVLQGAVPVPGVVTCAAQAATFTPTNPLEVGAAFTATVTTGVTDVAGNALGANYVWAFTTSALPDATPPTVTFTDPANGMNAVAADSKIHVAFDETMDCATLNAATFTLMQGAVPVLGLVSCIGPTATFTPTNPLAPSASFTATITTGAKDSVGNALAANYVWSFSTGALPDAIPPTVLSTKPINGALNVAVNSVVTATFSEVMDAATITAVTFTVKQGAVAVAGSVSYAGTTATFTPAVNLPVGQFTATVTNGVKDLAGNAMVANVVWLFTTGASPTVLSTNPANAAHNVALDRKVDAVFSVPMNPATINAGTFSLAQGAVPVAGVVSYVGSTATFTPAADYPNNTVLTATITTGAKDMNGNGLIKDYVWSFSTGAHAGPATVPLGAASTYAILAFNTVTNVNNPGTVVTGDLGISPGAALVGFPPGLVVGTTHLGDAVAAAAKGALLAAYNDAAGRLGAAVLPGDLSGLTFAPGLYKNSTSVMLSAGNFTLDAMGDSNAVFIFQMGSTLTTMPGTQVILAGSAKATNVFWAVGTSATFGTTSVFKGTVLAASAITMETGASLEGRILAQAAAVALDTNLITVPAP